MRAVLAGQMEVPSRYKEYIECIKTMQLNGSVYSKSVVDGLIERFIEVLDDNYHIRELYKRKGRPVETDEISAMIVAMQSAGERETKDSYIVELEGTEISAAQIPEAYLNTDEHTEQNSSSNKNNDQIDESINNNLKNEQEDKSTQVNIHAMSAPHSPRRLESIHKEIQHQKLLEIKEEISAVSAYAISILLIGAQIEDLLEEDQKK